MTLLSKMPIAACILTSFGTLLCGSSFAGAVVSQIYNGDLTLRTQAEVDAFGYREVTGNLFIQDDGNGHDDIVQLNGLRHLVSVGGTLSVRKNAALMDVDGLSALISVGEIHVVDNGALTGIDGLRRLTLAGWGLISENGALRNVDGLRGLATVKNLSIRENGALKNVDGLRALSTVEDLSLWGNDALENLDGLASLTAVESLSIVENRALTNLDGLRGLTSVGERLFVSENGAPADVDDLKRLTLLGNVTLGPSGVLTIEAPQKRTLAGASATGRTGKVVLSVKRRAAPGMLRVTRAGEETNIIEWESTPEVEYVLEYSSTMAPESWEYLAVRVGDGGRQSVKHRHAPGTSGFYRLVMLGVGGDGS